jgi:hypothetical protein
MADATDVGIVTGGVGVVMAAARAGKIVGRARSVGARAFWAAKPRWCWVVDSMSRRRLRRMLRRSGWTKCLRRLREWAERKRVWVKELRARMAAAVGAVAVAGVVDVA